MKSRPKQWRSNSARPSPPALSLMTYMPQLSLAVRQLATSNTQDETLRLSAHSPDRRISAHRVACRGPRVLKPLETLLDCEQPCSDIAQKKGHGSRVHVDPPEPRYKFGRHARRRGGGRYQ